MITYSTKGGPPISVREALSALNGAWDDRFEVSWHNGKRVIVTNPSNGHKVSCLLLGDEMSAARECIDWLTVGKPGFPPTFDRTKVSDATSLVSLDSVIRQVAKSHESEMVTDAFCDSLLLTDEEQKTACEAYADYLRSQGIDFVVAGTRTPEVAIMPADARRLNLLLEFRIFNPKIIPPGAYYMLSSRYDYFVRQMVSAGVPADKIKSQSRPTKTQGDSSKDTLQVTVEADAIRNSRLDMSDWDETGKKVIHIPSMDCKLTPSGLVFYVTVIETQTRVRVYLGVRMRNDAKVARVTGGRPLGETMGAKMIGRALAG